MRVYLGLALVALFVCLSQAELDVSISVDYLPSSQRIVWATRSVGFVLLDDGAVWRTTDNGYTFKITPIIAGSGVVGIYPQWTTNGSTIVFLAVPSYNTHMSYDTGASFVQAFSFPSATEIHFHPTERSWALVLDRPNKTEGAPSGFLRATLTFGGTNLWSNVSTAAYEGSWCGNRFEPKRLCYIADMSKITKTLFVSDDLGADVRWPLLNQPLDYFVDMFEFFVAVSGSQLWVSHDELHNFNKALFPFGLTIPQFEPTQILDTRNSVMLGATPFRFPKGDMRPHEGNVFLSDREGFKYNLVLSNVASLNNEWDFAPIYSLEGTYIANTLLQFNDGRFVYNETNVLIKTKFTQDFGLTWFNLWAPEFTASGDPIVCENLCSLNLFGRTTYYRMGGHGPFGQIYNNPRSVGLVVATGNVGNYLNVDGREVNTYVSRDGGRFWKEIVNGSHVYAYGERTGILVFVENHRETYTFKYSLDEGETIYEQSFTPPNSPVPVWSVETFDENGDIFLINATYENQTVIYALNFSSIRERPCTAEDYYEWQPAMFYNDTCINGHRITYIRRHHNSTCYGLLDSTFKNFTHCPCTRLDYECDYNFQQLVYGQCSGVAPDPASLCNATRGETKYNKTQGYRKTPGNTCVNGLPEYEPILTDCPPISTTTGSGSLSTTVGTLASSIATSTSSTGRSLSTSSTSGNEEAGGGKGVSSGGAAAGILIVAIVIGIVAFAGGVVAAFRSVKIRSLVPRDWRAGEHTTLL